MRVTINIFSIFRNAFRQEGDLSSTDRQGDFQPTVSSRRKFLETAGSTAIAVQAMPWILSACELNPEDDIETKLTAQFQKLMAMPNIDEPAHSPFSQGLDELLKIGRIDTQRFLKWYTILVNDKNQDVNYQKKQIVLETIGRKVIAGGSMHPSEVDLLEREKYVGEFFPVYTKLIKNNDSLRGFIVNALKTCDAVIYPRLKGIKIQEYSSGEIGPVGTAISEGILNLYETALKGVSKLPVIGGEIKSLIYEIPYDCEVFGDKQEKDDLEKGIVKEDLIKKAHDRVIAALSENFFGLKRNEPDIDGLNCLIQKINSSSFAWPPYILYGVIDRNPEYFESSIDNCIEGIEKSLATSDKKDLSNLVQLTKPCMGYLSFFSNLGIAGQAFYFPEKLPHHYPRIPKERKERVDKWALGIMRHIAKSVFAPIFGFVDNEIVTVKTNGNEKIIDDQNWNDLIKQLGKLLEGNPILCEEFVYAIRSRLQKNKDEPLLVEMNYKALGVAIPAELTVSRPSCSLALIKDTLPEEKPFQVIRSIGTALVMGMFYGSSNTEFRFSGEFLSAIEEYNHGNHSKINELQAKQLNDLERFVLDLMCLARGDSDVHRAIMPDFIFPKYKEDGSYREKAKPFYELKRNAFLVLASSASAIEIIDPHGLCPKSAYTKYQNAVIEFLENEFGLYTDPETIGEQIGALIKLYSSVYTNANQSKNFIYSKIKNLRVILADRILNPLTDDLLLKVMQESGDNRRVNDNSRDKLLKEYSEVSNEINKYKQRQAEIAVKFARDKYEAKDFQEYLAVNMKLPY